MIWSIIKFPIFLICLYTLTKPAFFKTQSPCLCMCTVWGSKTRKIHPWIISKFSASCLPTLYTGIWKSFMVLILALLNLDLWNYCTCLESYVCTSRWNYLSLMNFLWCIMSGPDFIYLRLKVNFWSYLLDSYTLIWPMFKTPY